MIHHPIVKILSPKVSVSSCGLNLENSIIDAENGDIKSTTSKVEDEDIVLTRFSLLVVEAIGNGSSCWLINNPHDIEASNNSSIFGGLPLRIVEVGWNCDDHILDRLTKVCLSSLLHLCQNHRRDLLWVEGLVLTLVLHLDLGLFAICNNLEGPMCHILLNAVIVKASSNQSLGIKDGVLGVHGNLVLGSISNQPLSFCEGNVGGRRPVALIVGNDLHLSMLEDTNTRVSGAKINANRGSLLVWSHLFLLFELDFTDTLNLNSL